MSDSLINECMEEWAKQHATCDKVLNRVINKLESELDDIGIHCRVTGRIKSEESFRAKLKKYIDKQELKNTKQIFETISDIIAIRVMTYRESERDEAVALIKELFNPAFPKKKGDAGFDIDNKDNDKKTAEH